VQQVGNAAQQATPRISTQEKALKDLARSAEETTRGVLQMALAARQGAGAFPQLALATREAWTGLQGVNVAMGALGVASRAMVVSLGAVAIGVGVVGAAVAAYGISVFKFSQEMFTLSKTARALGMTFGQLRGMTEQNERFGISVEQTTAQIGQMNEALTDLSFSGSKIRQQMLSQGVPPKLIDDYLRLTNAVDRYNFVRDKEKEIADTYAAQGHPEIGATLAKRLGGWFGVAGDAYTRPPMEKPTKEEEEANARIAKQSALIAEQWRIISKHVTDIKTEFLAWGLPVVLETLKLINTGFEGILTTVKTIALIGLKQIPILGQMIQLKQLYDSLTGGDKTTTPDSAPKSDQGGGGSWMPQGLRQWNTPPPGYHPTSFGGAANDNGGSARAVIKGGVYDALVEFYGFMQGGAKGGAGGIQNASLTTGNIPGAGPGGSALHSGGGYTVLPNGSDGGPGTGRGAGGSGGGGGVVDKSGKGVDPDTVGQLQQMASQGNTRGMQQLMSSRGYRVDSAWCGDLARTLVGGSGFQVPKGYPVASEWRREGVSTHAEGADINAPGTKFGSIVASKTNVPIGQTGGHVMTVVPGTYDPKNNTAEVIDTGGRRRRTLNGFELRSLPAAEAVAASGNVNKTSPSSGPSTDANVMPELSKFVAAKEQFRAHPFADFGTTGIGYGTPAAGRSSISEPDARKEMEGRLAESLKRVDELNPNLTQGQRMALASLDYNTGWIQKGGEKNDAMRAALKSGDLAGARRLFGTYTHVGGPQGRVLPGLASRRAEELGGFWDRPDPDRTALSKPLDRSALNDNNRIHSTGQLDVSVNAPPGTKVNYHGQNLLKNTSMQRQTQMMPTQGGPTVADTAQSYMRGGT
jgi:GH24 family phage-related lysozyme (muramidase)